MADIKMELKIIVPKPPESVSLDCELIGAVDLPKIPVSKLTEDQRNQIADAWRDDLHRIAGMQMYQGELSGRFKSKP